MPVLQIWETVEDCSTDIQLNQFVLDVDALGEDARSVISLNQYNLSIDAVTSAETQAEYSQTEMLKTDVLLNMEVREDLSATVALRGEYRESLKSGISLSIAGIEDWFADDSFSGAFDDLGVGLSLDIADVYRDLSVALSLNKPVPTFKPVFVQKPSGSYSLVASVNGASSSTQKIRAFNISPNKNWYVKIVENQARTGVYVHLYSSYSDAANETNGMAEGFVSFGTDVEVELEATGILDTNDSELWGLYNPDFDWHVVITASTVASHAATIYLVKKFYDLDEIRHPIYENPSLITSRATAEIDAHTYATINSTLLVADHQPTFNAGEIVQHTSSRLGTVSRQQIRSNRIIGGVDQNGESYLQNELMVTQYQGLSR